MDDFAFPDEETVQEMQREYENVLNRKNSVSALSVTQNGENRNRYFLTTLILALTISRILFR